ncbi:MAG: hypothetical protein FOGNACKC_04697 [Anaerolineae bacterium]|nr:hypothetical protein [Anaerolineae bacterium]
MPVTLHTAHNINYVECHPTDFVIQNERDIMDLVALCGDYEASNVIIYETNFSPDFFDLKTKFAGTLFQKFANYHIRGAAIISLANINSERFKELIVECNRGNLFRFFEEKAAAEKWLTYAEGNR